MIHLVGSAALLLLVYVLCGAILGHYVRTNSALVLAGVPVVLAAALGAGARFFQLQIKCRSLPDCIWPALFGVFALVAVLSWTLLYGSVSGFRLRTIVPASLEGVSAVGYCLAVAATAAVLEELAFRGIMQTWLRQRIGFVWALAITSLLFCAWHLGNPLISKIFLYYILLGATLGLVYERSGALALPVALHFALDAFTIVGTWIARPLNLQVILGHQLLWLTLVTAGLTATVLSAWLFPRMRRSHGGG